MDSNAFSGLFSGLYITVMGAVCVQLLISFNQYRAALRKGIGVADAREDMVFYVRVCIILALIMVFAYLSLARTPPPEKDPCPTAVAVILGNHAGSSVIPDQAYTELENHLDGVFNNGCLFAIVPDSTPYAKDIKEKTSADVIRELKKLKADAPEVDLLDAIWVARDALTSGDAANIENKFLVVSDTGISTAGTINFTEEEYAAYFRDDKDYPHDDFSVLANIIEKIKYRIGDDIFPNLSDINVLIIGEADRFSKEANYLHLSEASRRFIKLFWETVLKVECRAKSVSFRSVSGWDEQNKEYSYIEGDSSSYPFVSTVMIGYESILQRPYGQQSGSPNKSVKARIESKHLGFDSPSEDKKSYILYNDFSAKAYLHPYADDLVTFLEYYPNEKIIVAVSSILGEKNSDKSVVDSTLRAQTVVRLLTGLGVSESNLIPIGIGDCFPWKDRFSPNGPNDASSTESGRAVWLMLSGNEENDGVLGQLMDAFERKEDLHQETINQMEEGGLGGI